MILIKFLLLFVSLIFSSGAFSDVPYAAGSGNSLAQNAIDSSMNAVIADPAADQSGGDGSFGPTFVFEAAINSAVSAISNLPAFKNPVSLGLVSILLLIFLVWELATIFGKFGNGDSGAGKRLVHLFLYLYLVQRVLPDQGLARTSLLRHHN